MNQQPSHNSLWFLFARSLSGEITADEQVILKSILDHDVALQQQFDLMKRMWNAAEKNYTDTADEEKDSVSHILELVKTDGDVEEELAAIATKKHKLWIPAALKVAAIVILAVSSWMFSAATIQLKKKIQQKRFQLKTAAEHEPYCPMAPQFGLMQDHTFPLTTILKAKQGKLRLMVKLILMWLRIRSNLLSCTFRAMTYVCWERLFVKSYPEIKP